MSTYYQVYTKDNKQIQIIGFSKTLENAMDTIKKIVSDFIIDKEGRNKLNNVFVPVDLDFNIAQLDDGFYIKEYDSKVIIYLRKTVNNIIPGYFWNGIDIKTVTEKVKVYDIVQFNEDLMNEINIDQHLIANLSESILDAVNNMKSKDCNNVKSEDINKDDNEVKDDVVKEVKNETVKELKNEVVKEVKNEVEKVIESHNIKIRDLEEDINISNKLSSIDKNWKNNSMILQLLSNKNMKTNEQILDNFWLYTACNHGNSDHVQQLLENGVADPTICDNYAFKMACKNGHHKIVKLLLDDRRCDPRTENDYAFRWAGQNEHLEVLQLLLEDDRIDPHFQSNKALTYGLEHHKYKLINLLINNKKFMERITQDPALSQRTQKYFSESY